MELPRDARAQSDQILSDAERRALSDKRIKTGFVLFTTGMLIAMSGLIFLLVTQIFDTLTPSLRRDLEQKALHGAISLSHELDLGLATGAEEEIARAVRDDLADPDVRAIVALDRDGQVVYRYGRPPQPLATLFASAPRSLQRRPGEIWVWAETRIEGIALGRVALVVSTERVAAGDRLRTRILAAVGAGCLVALAASLLFVSLYIGPILRITHQAIARLEQTTAQALEATRLKSEFLANMSHEIRTPMNGVLAMADLLLRTQLAARQQRFAEVIRASAQALLTIIDDVLDFSKIEAGKYELSPTPFNVRLTVRDLVELLAPRAQSKGIELLYHIGPEVPEVVRADADRFRQILTNLLGNAVKFTERGEVVLTLSARAARDGAILLRASIRDSGPGISAEGLSKLFLSFSQVDGSSTRKHGGTGLGLAISQRLARLMGGEVGVESQRGQGSTFWFTISAEVVEAAARQVSGPVGRRALIVDDNAAFRAVLERQLAQWGLSYESLASATEAVLRIETTLMEDKPFDVVLIEAQLESGRGVELAKAIAKTLPMPVALLTESGSPAPIVRVPSDLPTLSKPLRESDLFDFLMECFQPRDRGPGSEAPRGVGESDAPALAGHVLVVDDNEINQTVALELLAELGYTSDVANNGLEAVHALAIGAFDAVLMDCQMPVMDGYQATREIRRWEAAERRGRTPIIALTAHALAGERDKVVAAGMDEYLTKPIVAGSLQRSLARQIAVGRRRQRKDAQSASEPAVSAAPDPQANGEPAAPGRSSEGALASGAARGPNFDRVVPGPSGEPRSRQGDEERANAAPSSAGDERGRALLDPEIRRSEKLTRLFLELVPGQIARLSEAVARADPEQVRLLSHKLKGSCASVGARAMAELCEAVQQAAALGDLSQAGPRTTEIGALFELTAERMRPELKPATLARTS